MKQILLIIGILLMISNVSADSITYDTVNNIITVTGYSEASACTFDDIYNADVANGWGVVSKQGTNQFLLKCRLYVGDGSTVTWMETVEEQITFETNGCGSWKNVLYIKDNAIFTSGVLISESKKQGKHGSSITIRITDVGDKNQALKVSSSGIAYLYATHISCINSSTLWIRNFNSNCRIYQTIFTNCRSLIDSAGADVQNLLWVGNYYALERTYFSTDSAYVWAFGCSVDVYTPPHEELGQPPLTNFYAEKIATWSTPANYVGGLRNFLGSLPLPIPSWYGSPAAGCQIKWYADMDLKITDKDNNNIVGATITVKNKNGDIQFSTDTDANGEVSKTVWVVKDEWSGSGSSNNRTDYNPFTIEIKKSGYQIYTQKFTLYKKIDWTIALQPECSIMINKSINLTTSYDGHVEHGMDYKLFDYQDSIIAGKQSFPTPSTFRGFAEFDISLIPKNANITNVTFKYDGRRHYIDCNISNMTVQPTNSTAQQIYNNIGTGTDYYNGTGFPVLGSNQSINLGLYAINDLQRAINDSNWFALGIYTNETLNYISDINASENVDSTPPPTLQIDYQVPAENGITTETKLISTQVGARKTTMAAAFMLLSGMFMMMATKRRHEDDQYVT